MFRLWRSEKQIQEKLAAYLTQVTRSLHELKQTFPACLDGVQASHPELENPVHGHESVADDMRRELQRDLVSGKLLPESRAEMLSLIEAIDRLPNLAEEIVDFFAIQRLQVPSELHEDTRTLLWKALESCATMSETVLLIFDDLRKIADLAHDVDRLESEVDHLERRLVRRVFEQDLDLAEKLQLRDLVQAIASLADRAENVTDMVQWMALKRHP